MGLYGVMRPLIRLPEKGRSIAAWACRLPCAVTAGNSVEKKFRNRGFNGTGARAQTRTGMAWVRVWGG